MWTKLIPFTAFGRALRILSRTSATQTWEKHLSGERLGLSEVRTRKSDKSETFQLRRLWIALNGACNTCHRASAVCCVQQIAGRAPAVDSNNPCTSVRPAQAAYCVAIVRHSGGLHSSLSDQSTLSYHEPPTCLPMPRPLAVLSIQPPEETFPVDVSLAH